MAQVFSGRMAILSKGIQANGVRLLNVLRSFQAKCYVDLPSDQNLFMSLNRTSSKN